MQTQDSFGRRAGRALTRLFIALILLALAGAVVVLLSQLNSRTYMLQRESNRLVVHRGRLLPWGTQPYAPADARLSDAYASIEAEGILPNNLIGRRFGDREELDRALFELFALRAVPLIDSEDREAQQRAITYLRRAQLLSGITSEQRLQLEKLHADAAYFQARMKLDDARRLIAEAVTQLRLAADSDNTQAKSAHRMLSEIGPASNALEEALRRAVFTIGESRPAAQPPESSPNTEPTTPDAAADAGSTLQWPEPPWSADAGSLEAPREP